MRAAALAPFLAQESGPHFRSPRTYLLRGLYLGASAIVLYFLLPHVSSGETGTFARELYNGFYVTTYAMVCLLAPVLTARAVFRDKVAGLASVIAASPVSAAEYCLGRVLGQAAALGAILTVGGPLFVTMIFLHAASLGEVVKGVGFLALAALLSSSLAVGRAIDSDSFPGAVMSSYALTLFPGCLTPLLWMGFFGTLPTMEVWQWAFIAVSSPLYLAYCLFRGRVLFRSRFVSEGAAVPPWQVREGRYRGPIPGNPVYWWERARAGRILEKSFGRADSLSGAVRILTGLAVAASLIPLCIHPVGVGALLAMGCLAAAAQAASSVTSDREQRVWATLLSSPLSPEAVVYGKLGGILAGLRWVWLAVAVGGGIHLILALGGTWPMGSLLGWGAGILSFGFLLVAAGLQASLVSPTTAKAMARTLGLGLVLGAPPFLLENLGMLRLGPGAAASLVALWGATGAVLAFLLPAAFRRAARADA